MDKLMTMEELVIHIVSEAKGISKKKVKLDKTFRELGFVEQDITDICLDLDDYDVKSSFDVDIDATLNDFVEYLKNVDG